MKVRKEGYSGFSLCRNSFTKRWIFNGKMKGPFHQLFEGGMTMSAQKRKRAALLKATARHWSFYAVGTCLAAAVTPKPTPQGYDLSPWQVKGKTLTITLRI